MGERGIRRVQCGWGRYQKSTVWAREVSEQYSVGDSSAFCIEFARTVYMHAPYMTVCWNSCQNSPIFHCVCMATAALYFRVWRQTSRVQMLSPTYFIYRVGHNRIYIRCIYGIFGRKITKYTVIYDVYMWFWPTLYIYLFITDNIHTETRLSWL